MDDKSIHAPQEPPSPQGARSADVSLVGAKAWWLGALAPVLLGLISISAVVTPWEHVAVLCRVFGAVSLLLSRGRFSGSACGRLSSPAHLAEIGSRRGLLLVAYF